MNDDNVTLIHVYTRAQALKDGLQVDVSATAKDAGFVYPVFLTRLVFEKYVKVPDGVEDQDEAGRLWDILWMLASAVRNPSSRPADWRQKRSLTFSLYVRNDNRWPDMVSLSAVCGPLDIDEPQPAVTVMMPDED